LCCGTCGRSYSLAEAVAADKDEPLAPLPDKDPDGTEAPAADEDNPSDEDKP